jgi:nitrogen-specific signal transduction histidine kinase
VKKKFPKSASAPDPGTTTWRPSLGQPAARATAALRHGDATAPGERERLQRVAAQLKTLYHMGRDLGEDENWSDALDRFLMALVNFMGANGAGLLLFSNHERELSARAVFHLDGGLVTRVIETVREGWKSHVRASEIHSLESYASGERPTSCLERATGWGITVIPMRHRGRALGFLVLDKGYASGIDFQWDYHFLSTLQTIFAEEIANASYISELRQLSRFNHKVLDNIRSGVVTTDPDGRIRYANSWANEMCPRLRSVSRTQVAFDDLFRVYEGTSRLFSEFMASESDSTIMEVECHGGESAFPARLRLTRMHDDLVNGTVVVAIFDDLSEHKRMEEALRRNDRLRAIGQLSAGVAHEIRNPLAGIATTAEVLSGKLGPDDDRSRYTRVILDEVTRLDGIVRNLLAFARPPRPTIAPCVVGDLLDRIKGLVGEQAHARGVELRTESVDMSRACLADGAQITQVLLNLTLNAVQACGAGDCVKVAARTESAGAREWMLIEVEDTGAGVPREIRGRLFEPFVTTRSQGTGLGLAISRQIVEDHHGSLTCTFLERGTRFTVKIPAHTVAAAVTR